MLHSCPKTGEVLEYFRYFSGSICKTATSKSLIMKTLYSLAILFFSFAIVAQNPIDENAEKQLILKASKEWSTAIIKKDSVFLEKIMSTKFNLNADLPRNVWMKNTLHHLKITELKMLTEPKVTVFPKTAICEANWRFAGSFNGKDNFDNTFLIMDIWTKENGDWQILQRLSKPIK